VNGIFPSTHLLFCSSAMDFAGRDWTD
jgi:hypothetical protein